MTRRRELALAGVGALLVLAVGVLLLVRPTQQATTRARADRDAAVGESQALRDQIKALEALKPQEAELRRRADLVKQEFPATPALPALVDALQEAAGLAGVDLVSVAPTAPKVATASPQLAEISTAVNVTGGYFQIQDFLVRLENLVKGADPGRLPPRSMLVRSVNLASSEGAGTGTGDSAAAVPDTGAPPDQLQASIVLLVFQLAQPGGAPSAAPAAPAAAAAPGAQVR